MEKNPSSTLANILSEWLKKEEKPKKGNFRELKSEKCTGEACPQTPLWACAVGARLGNPSVFILDPCLELAQVLHDLRDGAIWCLAVIFRKSGTVGWKRQEACRISVLTDRQHADNISFPNERELLKILTVLYMESMEAEKSFSCIWRIHTRLRNTMTT